MANKHTRQVSAEIAIETTNVPSGETHVLKVLGETVEIPAGMRRVTDIIALGKRMLPQIREARHAAVLKMLAAEPQPDMPLSEIKIKGTGEVKFTAIGDECPTCAYTGHAGVNGNPCPTCHDTGVLDEQAVGILMGTPA